MVVQDSQVFICLFLHQTTTMGWTNVFLDGCLSVYSYIKPQRRRIKTNTCARCLSVYSYIKPQHFGYVGAAAQGVYLSIPTSNHNFLLQLALDFLVFICLFLHQTTTESARFLIIKEVFICLFLHQTTTVIVMHAVSKKVFICLFLHQTTTTPNIKSHSSWCLSVYSYIKPQRNCQACCYCFGCLSVYSYIKPQHCMSKMQNYYGVYLSIPTSNHNIFYGKKSFWLGVYLSIPTSNHNLDIIISYITRSYISFFV